MNSCNTDIFFSNYYHLLSVRFELNLVYLSAMPFWSVNELYTVFARVKACHISQDVLTAKEINTPFGEELFPCN